MSDEENTTDETTPEQPAEETPNKEAESTTALAARVGELEAGVADREQRLDRLNGTMAQRDARIAELEGAVGGLERTAGEREQHVEGMRTQLSQALEAYRTSLLEADPGLPEDLVAGSTLEELQASRARAKQIVESVRGRLEDQTHLERTPSGAPARSETDVSALSPEEKIRLGLSRR